MAYLVPKLRIAWGKKGSELEGYYFQHNTKESHKSYLEHLELFSALETRVWIHGLNYLNFKKIKHKRQT